MADLLVRLYDLPPLAPVVEALAAARDPCPPRAGGGAPAGDGLRARARLGGVGGGVRGGVRARAARLLRRHRAARRRRAGGRRLRARAETLLGFACYEATCRNFFGPELVHPQQRAAGHRPALLLAALHAMRAEGYAYAIIGWASSVDFYRRAVGRDRDRRLGAGHLPAGAGPLTAALDSSRGRREGDGSRWRGQARDLLSALRLQSPPRPR